MTDSTPPVPEPGGSSISYSDIAAPPRFAASRRWMVVGLVLGIVGFVAAAAFAAVTLVGGGDSRREAAQDFLGALEAEDVLGIGETLLPGERAFLFDPLLDTIEEAERLGILEGVDLTGLQGVDLEFADLEFTVHEVADDLAWVAIDGTAMLTVQGGAVPVGPLLRRYLPDDWAEQLSNITEPTPIADGFGLAVLKRDDEWRVSLAHTIGEAARRDAGLDFPPSPVLLEPSGAPTPEEAMEQAFLSLVMVDVRGLVDVLDPDETEALRRYSALFMDDWDAGLVEFHAGLAEVGVVYSVDEVVAGSEQREDTTVAWIADVPRFSFEVPIPDLGGVFRISRDGDCLRILLPEQLAEAMRSLPPFAEIDLTDFDGVTCASLAPLESAFPAEQAPDIDTDILLDLPVIGLLVERWSASLENMGEAGASAVQFQVTERGGRFFMSPSRTLHRWFMAGLSTLDQELLGAVGDEIRAAAENPGMFEAQAEPRSSHHRH